MIDKGNKISVDMQRTTQECCNNASFKNQQKRKFNQAVIESVHKGRQRLGGGVFLKFLTDSDEGEGKKIGRPG